MSANQRLYSSSLNLCTVWTQLVSPPDTLLTPSLHSCVLGYVTDVLQDSLVYSEHAGKSEIDLEDLRLAIRNQLRHMFVPPPSRDVPHLPLGASHRSLGFFLFSCSSSWPLGRMHSPFLPLTRPPCSSYHRTIVRSWEPATVSLRRESRSSQSKWLATIRALGDLQATKRM